MTRRIRMARKRLMVANERIWAAWFRALEPPLSKNDPADGPIYQRKLRQFRAIERRKERIA